MYTIDKKLQKLLTCLLQFTSMISCILTGFHAYINPDMFMESYKVGIATEFCNICKHLRYAYGIGGFCEKVIVNGCVDVFHLIPMALGET